jgi:uncharacterized protein (TIGR02466 family)
MIESWFPTLIYSLRLDSLDRLNAELARTAYNIKQQYPNTNTDWRCDTYNTIGAYDAVKNSTPEVSLLISECSQQVFDFAKVYGITNGKAVCKDFWFNIAPPGSYQEYHQHAGSHFSLVYYVQTATNCGNTVFRSPESATDMYPLPIEPKEQSASNYKTCFYTPSNSNLLIFRSNLLHMVEKNLSTTDRISISMNFDIVREL